MDVAQEAETSTSESKSPEGAPLSFDLFVMYAKADAAFVRSVLVPGINLPSERVLLVEELTPGAPRVSELARGVSRSRFSLVVLSPAYLADGWATLGEQLASHLSVGTDRIIPLYLEDCELPVHLDFRVALDFRNEDDRTFELSRLRKLLHAPAPTLPLASAQPTKKGPTLPASKRAWLSRAPAVGLAGLGLCLLVAWERARSPHAIGG